MDAQFWIYLIIAIIYVISRAMKKAENPPRDVGEQRPDRPVRYEETRPQAEPPKQLTFEELLREITEAKKPRQTYETPQPDTEYVDYDDQVTDEATDLEEKRYQESKRDKERTFQLYEQAKREAFVRPSLEETMSLRDTNVEFRKFKEFEQQEQPDLLAMYTKKFWDPEGLKQAVVMSEILKRKF